MRPGLQAIEIGQRALEDHSGATDPERLERIRELAAPLSGMRVVHVSGGAQGGRVPELLGSLLPLLAGLGIEVEWRVVFGDHVFGATASELHDGMQGAEAVIGDDDWSGYLEACAGVGEVEGSVDVAVAHDPATLGVALAAREAAERFVWRCHVDASEPDPGAWERARGALEPFALAVFPLEQFRPPELPVDTESVAPAIDPLAAKNQDLPIRLSGGALRTLGVDLTQPFCCHVGRFDRWKDPHAAIDAVAAARQDVPELQLVLAGALAGDTPDDWRVVKEMTDYAGDRPGVVVLTSYSGLGPLEVNALQRISRLELQSSLREGFGLAASEALWKGTPVIARRAPGPAAQIEDGRHGYLTDGTEQTAERIVEIVRDPALGIELGEAGRARVRERFLITRLLEDELRLLASVASSDAATVEP